MDVRSIRLGAIIWATVSVDASAFGLLAICQNDAPPTLESGQILEDDLWLVRQG